MNRHLADVVLALRYCAVPGCGHRWQGRGLCNSHYSRWQRAGKPDRGGVHRGDRASGKALAAAAGRECYDLRALPFSLRLEIAYALQCGSNQRATGLRPLPGRRGGQAARPGQGGLAAGPGGSARSVPG